MRVPHTIPKNTRLAYAASEQTLNLVAERFRALRSEDLQWDISVPPSLIQVCVKVLCANFQTHSEVLPHLPIQDHDYLLEVLPVDLPIHIVAPIIEDGIYWQRCCETRWKKQPLDIRKYGNSWRRMYLERHAEEFIHYQEPGYIDWNEVSHVMEVCAPYVIRLNIKELKPPRDLQPKPRPPDECIRGTIDPDHMDLSPVLEKLANLEELIIRFGVRGCGMKYAPIFFVISRTDVMNLSVGLEKSKNITTFRLHRCDINDAKVNIILSALIKCQRLETLEISHCTFGDIAAKSIGQLIIEHENLKNVSIENNKIGSEGVLGIAFALKGPKCCPIKTIDLQLNLIGDEGAEYLASAILKNTTLEELNLGGAGITASGAKLLAASLLISSSVRRLILCNNHLDTSVAEDLISAVHSNRNIETLDIRNCGIGTENETTIHKYIAKNRHFHRNL